ncbi:MAG TPA: alpha/beta hydrolase [Candidatus Acidoferrales bacterium]|jgi:pimeloyl-ACP methyl ester carboxylesterase|nr:alpha/beta hydrolase [Candidatus Acidoferrales bacterium]
MDLIPIVAWLLGITLLVALLGVVYQILGTRRDGKVYPPPGRLVDLGSHRLHLLESGHGSPTILLEAGLMSTVLSWSDLQRELSRSFRVVSYDRAGLGWSDQGPMPRTADRIVDELHTMLERAAIPPPYVLVGHSFGGLTMPLFATRYPDELAGMVLVDPVAPAEWNPPSEHDRKLTRIGAKVCRRAALLTRIGLIRFVAFLLTTRAKKPASYLVRLISRGTPDEAGSVSSPWFSALPANEKAMASVFWIQPKFALTIASQLENLPISAARVGQLDKFCDKAVVILSARTAPEARRKEHAAMAGRLPLGNHVLAGNSNHWIMQEEPDLVIRAIEKVIKHSENFMTTVL